MIPVCDSIRKNKQVWVFSKLHNIGIRRRAGGTSLALEKFHNRQRTRFLGFTFARQSRRSFATDGERFICSRSERAEYVLHGDDHRRKMNCMASRQIFFEIIEDFIYDYFQTDELHGC